MANVVESIDLETVRRWIDAAYKHSPEVKRRVDNILNSRMAPGGRKTVTYEEVEGQEPQKVVTGGRKNKFIAKYHVKGTLNSFDRTKQLTKAFEFILWKHITTDTASYNRRAGGSRNGLKDFPKAAIKAKYPKKSRKTVNGDYLARISLDANLVRRHSLLSKGGIDNIIQLFLTGYRARRTVGGVWIHFSNHQPAAVSPSGKPMKVGSLKYRPSADNKHFYPRGNFLKNALREFNSTFGPGARAFVIKGALGLGQANNTK